VSFIHYIVTGDVCDAYDIGLTRLMLILTCYVHHLMIRCIQWPGACLKSRRLGEEVPPPNTRPHRSSTGYLFQSDGVIFSAKKKIIAAKPSRCVVDFCLWRAERGCWHTAKEQGSRGFCEGEHNVTTLFSLFFPSYRHVQADSTSRGLYTLLSCQVYKGIVAIEERLGECRSEVCVWKDNRNVIHLVHALRTQEGDRILRCVIEVTRFGGLENRANVRSGRPTSCRPGAD
jgi:hypothetical protein